MNLYADIFGRWIKVHHVDSYENVNVVVTLSSPLGPQAIVPRDRLHVVAPSKWHP